MADEKYTTEQILEAYAFHVLQICMLTGVIQHKLIEFGISSSDIYLLRQITNDVSHKITNGRMPLSYGLDVYAISHLITQEWVDTLGDEAVRDE